MPCAYGGLQCPSAVSYVDPSTESHTFDSQRCWWETAVHLHGHQHTSIILRVPWGMYQASEIIGLIPRCNDGHMMSLTARLHALMYVNVSFVEVTDRKALKCLNQFKVPVA